jgi:tRNA(His) guanylyltransferase
MKFDELDARLRVYETADDYCVLPGIHMVARIDGRSFTRLTKEVHRFKAPFDERFRDCMVATTEHLMNCGLRVIYAYTQSDEISLVIHQDESLFSRKTRKLNSVLAGEASAKFSLMLGDVAAFDCRISQLPSRELVIEYLRWRSEDAHRNALNAHCYWALRQKGADVSKATDQISGLTTAQKNELLYTEAGVNFNDLPNWHKRGVGLYWESYEKIGLNPVTGEQTTCERQRIHQNFDLPMRDAYSDFVRELMESAYAERR